jgi:multiple sugar transport system substrate-binding protein
MVRRWLWIVVGVWALGLAAQASGQAVVVLRVFGERASMTALRPAVEAFNEQNAGRIRAEVETVGQPAEALQRALAQFLSGSAVYDVLAVLRIAQVGSYLEPLTPFFRREGLAPARMYGSGTLGELSYRGEVVALPFRLNMNVLYYRRDLFEAAGLRPPGVLDEYLDVARKLTRRSAGGVSVYGAGLELSEPQWSTISFADFFLAHGGRMLTVDGRRPHDSLRGELTIRILRLFRQLTEEGLIPNPLAYSWQENVALWQQGRVAMSPEHVGRVFLVEDPNVSRVGGRVAYAALPSRRLGPERPIFRATVWKLGIDRNSTRKEAAWQFLRFVTSSTQLRRALLATGNPAPLAEVYEEPEVRRRVPYAEAVRRQLQGGYMDPLPIPRATEVERVVHEEVHAVVLGRKTAEGAAADLYRRVEEVLAR